MGSCLPFFLRCQKSHERVSERASDGSEPAEVVHASEYVQQVRSGAAAQCRPAKGQSQSAPGGAGRVEESSSCGSLWACMLREEGRKELLGPRQVLHLLRRQHGKDEPGGGLPLWRQLQPPAEHGQPWRAQCPGCRVAFSCPSLRLSRRCSWARCCSQAWRYKRKELRPYFFQLRVPSLPRSISCRHCATTAIMRKRLLEVTCSKVSIFLVTTSINRSGIGSDSPSSTWSLTLSST